jgi:hypothetical protein
MTLTPFTEDEHRYSDIFSRHINIILITFVGFKHKNVFTEVKIDISSIFAPTVHVELDSLSCRIQGDPTVIVRAYDPTCVVQKGSASGGLEAD